AELGVEDGVFARQLEGALRDEAESAPLEVRPKLEDVGEHAEGGGVAFGRHDAGVLVLDFTPPFGQLTENHVCRLEHVERLEAGDDDGLSIFGGDEMEWPRA